MKNALIILVFLLILYSLYSFFDQKDKKNQAFNRVYKDTFTVLAGSELKDLENIIPDIEKKTGIKIDLKYTGTLDGIEKLLLGEKYDAAWFSHAKYLILSNKDLVKASEKIMLSPVIIGIKESKVREFNWINKEITWSDIAQKIKEKKLTFAMTNPTTSNTGFSAVLGVVSSLSGNPDSINISDIDIKKLQEFYSGMKLTAGSSGWLAEAYIREQDKIDAIINYESVIISMNKEGKLKEKLFMVYPHEGIITADYPLVLLNETKRDIYNEIVSLLKSDEYQRVIMEKTYRRPINPNVTKLGVFPKDNYVELPFPAKLEVINSILESYLNHFRPPAHSIFVIDVSGSMRGSRIEELKKSLLALTGEDKSLTGRFARFQLRERIDMIPFDDKIYPRARFELTNEEIFRESIEKIRTFIRDLTPAGKTAIFSAVVEGYKVAIDAKKKDPERYYTIVLMTDGENNSGLTVQDFIKFYNNLPQEMKDIKVFTILYGEANPTELKTISDLTGGRVFDATKDNLSVVYKHIRGYQ